MRPTLLSDEEIAVMLTSFPLWFLEQGQLTRTAVAKDFHTAMQWVDAIAEVAEAMDHHPDIDIRWTKLRVSVMTHDKEGLTTLDFELAARVDRICL
ncbi:MAG: 4a-hydroxytetrahydrobiopterin dehydratase [Actinomycetota bacterium]|nr:4a-hydroxytetrahydrobiopterin dehydratase [Actinomycetota bacterium]